MLINEMKKIKLIAVFHCSAAVGSAWGCAEGIVVTLRKMGFNVLDCGRPEYGRFTIDDLIKCDLIILSAPEWYFDKINFIFGNKWFDLKVKKIAWFAESAHRDDRDFSFLDVVRSVDSCFFPAIQDAEEFGGHWMPFGVDEDVFRPLNLEKKFNVSFIGSMYPKRIEFVSKIKFPVTHILSLSDPDPLQSFNLLAQAYNSTKIFLNLPALSRLLVTKVTEVMACGTMLITPKIDHLSAIANMNQFRDGIDLVYYDHNNLVELQEKLEYYKANPKEVDRISTQGCEIVTKNFTLKNQLSKIFEMI